LPPGPAAACERGRTTVAIFATRSAFYWQGETPVVVLAICNRPGAKYKEKSGKTRSVVQREEFAMAQLGGIDASFLYMETPETPMHVAGFTLFELPEGHSGGFYDHFRKFFEGRVHLIPIFSKKLARAPLELDHPGWVDVDKLDFDYHIRSTILPKPGTWKQLEETIARLHSIPLDRTKPLWQFDVIEGLEDGRAALYSKVHHAAVDGGAGMVIVKALYDVTPVPREVEPAQPRVPVEKPTAADRYVNGVADLVGNVIRHQLNALKVGADIATKVTSALTPKIDGSNPLAGLMPKPLSGIPAIVAPKTPFNVTITKERSYAARALSLKDAKAVCKATGTKINDVVMAVCGGALRRYLKEKKALPEKPLLAFVPISLREMGNTDINNQVFGMNCALATDIADPLERLKAVQTSSGDAKSISGGMKDIAPKDFTLLGAPLLLPALMQLYGRTGLADVLPQPVNVVISNTPGPPMPIYCAGAKVLALYPVSIPIHGIALNLTVQSYVDELDFGLVGDSRAVPDIALIADYLGDALAELKAAVEKAAPPPSKTQDAATSPRQ
jgi:diacylglycerol O-acyltransferase